MSAPQQSDQTLTNAKIRIITNSDIRYEGILYKINPEEKTITLRNVKSFGTEDRRPEKKLPASDMVYEYIVFRSIEIKDLIVLKDETHVEEKPVEQPKVEHQSETKKVEKKETKVPTKEPEKVTKAEPARIEVKRDNEPEKKEYRQPEGSFKTTGTFQFEKMVESLSDFERNKNENAKKYESKYENDGFFDDISSSVASDRKREIESYNDKKLDRDTFGHMPKIHFHTDYNRHYDRRGGGGAPFNKGPSNRYRNDGYDNQPRDNNDNFKKNNNNAKRKYRRGDEDDYVYVKKET